MGLPAIAAVAAVSVISSYASAQEQVNTANDSAELQGQQIREQQVQLRLQDNQASIERLRKLQSVLATEEVDFGMRGISGGSGNVLAAVSSNMHEFFEDENAARLNLSAKQLALSRQKQLVEMQRSTNVFTSQMGFVKEASGTLLSAYQVPSKSLIDASQVQNTAPSSSGYARNPDGSLNAFDVNAIR